MFTKGLHSAEPVSYVPSETLLKLQVPPDREDKEANRTSGTAYAAALALFASVASFCGLGWLADRWWGTAPWLLAGGLVLGAVVGFYQFIRLTSKL